MSKPVEVAGILLKAQDTGRVLLLQRSFADESDPARGKWEAAGGHLEEGEDPFMGGVREWCEEMRTRLPLSKGQIVTNWVSPNGIYQGFLVVVGSESDVDINLAHEQRAVHNPDDPDGDDVEAMAWWDVKDIIGNRAMRKEFLQTTPWPEVRRAKMAQRKAASEDYRGSHQPLMDGDPLHDLSSKGSFPPDVYDHPEWYSFGDHAHAAHRVIHRVKGKPEADVTIYRSVPHGVSDINQGDWVTTAPGYAREHGMDANDPGHDWPVLKAKVKAKHVVSGGSDLMEWGYNGPTVQNAQVHYPGGRKGREEHEKTKPDYWAKKVEDGLQVYQSHAVSLPSHVDPTDAESVAQHVRANPLPVHPTWHEDMRQSISAAKRKASPGQHIVTLRHYPQTSEIHAGDDGEVWLKPGTEVSRDRVDVHDHEGQKVGWGYAKEPITHKVGSRTRYAGVHERAEHAGEGGQRGPGLGEPRGGHRGAAPRRLEGDAGLARGAAGRPGVRAGLSRTAADSNITWHPKATKDLKALDRPVQKQILQTIDGISSGDPTTLAQTHPLKGTMKGWYATKASRGHRIIHQPNEAGGVHVGYVGLHEYEKAEQRLALNSAGPLPEGFQVHYVPPEMNERSSSGHKIIGTVPSEVRPGQRNEVGTMHLDEGMDWAHQFGSKKDQGPYDGPRRVSGISVDPRMRNRGIATALWEHAKSLGLNPAHDDSGLQTWDGKGWAAATP